MKRFLLIIVCLFILIGCGEKSPYKEQTENDRLNFKSEYEVVNSELDDDGIPLYSPLTINENNKIVYLTYEEVLDFFENGTGVFYFGRPRCPWCRLLVPALLELGDKENTYIYYYDIESDRNENNDKYKSFLTLLGDHLPVDTVTQKEDDPNFDENLKRIVLPQLFFVKDGNIKDELMAYQHEYLKNNEKDKMLELLESKYKKIK